MGERSKLGFVKKVRGLTDRLFLGLPLPKTNPNRISGLSIVTSVLFILSMSQPVLALTFLLLTLFLDWFDGLIAKKHGLCCEKGYMVDVTSDRLSEGIIFSVFFFPWFPLFALNTVLTLLSFERKKHIIIPLRHIFFIYLLAVFLIYGFFAPIL